MYVCYASSHPIFYYLEKGINMKNILSKHALLLMLAVLVTAPTPSLGSFCDGVSHSVPCTSDADCARDWREGGTLFKGTVRQPHCTDLGIDYCCVEVDVETDPLVSNMISGLKSGGKALKTIL